MEITIKNTTKIVEANGVPARIWEGATNTGISVHCLITRIAVDKDSPPEVFAQFENELEECSPPSAAIGAYYPLRLIL
jgi:hypothetical protein